MRYLVFVKMAEEIGDPPESLVEAMAQEAGAAFASGAMVSMGGLYPLSQSTEIRLDGGEITTIDGPYAEAKEVVGGFAILDVRSHEEAVEHSRRVLELHREHWPAWRGSMELRRIADDS
jgi:hypothetical protein